MLLLDNVSRCHVTMLSAIMFQSKIKIKPGVTNSLWFPHPSAQPSLNTYHVIQSMIWILGDHTSTGYMFLNIQLI